MGNESKWKANQDKVAFLKTFPGWLSSWDQGIGTTIEQVLPIAGHAPYSTLMLSQGHFTVVPPVQAEPQILTAALLVARPHLESQRREAFAEYDRLSAIDREAGRQARLENILNAIDNNVEQIPELKSHLRELVQRWDTDEGRNP